MTPALRAAVFSLVSVVAVATLGAAAALGLGCGGGPPAAPDKPAPITQPADHCTTADDCALVDACCGCNAGGRRFAIRKDNVAGFAATRDQRCAGVVCAQVVSQEPSCDAEPICGSRNRCRVAPHMQHQ